MSELLVKLKSRAIRRQGYARVRGVKLAVDRSVISKPVIRQLALSRYEVPEANALEGILRADVRVLELGGGIGFMSALAAGRIDLAKGRVVVYGANPLLVPIIERTHALNGSRAEVHNTVLLPGDASGSTKFYRRFNFPESSLSGDAPGVVEVIDVPVRSFDEVVRELAPTVLVVDIEGGETTLFATADLSSVRCAVVEFHPAITGDKAISDTIAVMRENGLHLSIALSAANVLSFVRDEITHQRST